MTEVQDAPTRAVPDADVDVQLDAVSAIGFAMAHSGIPVVRELRLRNLSGRRFAGVRVTVEVAALGRPIAEPWHVEVEALGATGLTFDHVVLRLDPVEMADVEDRRAGEIRVTVSSDDGLHLVSRHAVDVLAHNQWQLFPGDDAVSCSLLAPFVQPNHPLVQDLLARARQLLERSTGSRATEGYQGDAARAVAISQAIYEALAERRISYSNPPASWDQRTQKVRLAGEVLGEDAGSGVGTCLDTTITFAACAEAAGLRPVLVLVRGHAFVAVSTRNAPMAEQSVVTDPNTFANLLDAGVLVPVETTVLTGSTAVPFLEATKEARRRLAAVGLSGFHAAVDVAAARRRGLSPLPAVRRHADGAVEVIAYQPFVPPEFRVPEQRQEPSSRGRRRDAAPLRIQRWKTALLDLSLRNPLLNLPSGDTVARALVPPGAMGKIEDHLHRGGSLNLRAHDQVAGEDRARGVRSAQELLGDDLAGLLFSEQALFLHYSEATFLTRVRGLVRRARTSLEESGSNSLFLGLGTLTWELEGRQIVSPLVLVPVRITGGSGRTKRFVLQLDDSGGSTPNFCLLEKLRESCELELPGLREPEEDSAGIDVDKVMHDVRTSLLEAGLPFRVDDTAVLANLQFNTYRVWKDVDDHWLRFLDSPLVRHLVETPTQDFAVQPGGEHGDVDLPLPCDESQYAAVQAAIAGETFVLEGPPGTGKSQTITNIVAGALAAGKRVLFVAEKPAALEVVKRRLDAVGVGPLCLDLHGRTRKRSDVAAAVKRSLELHVEADRVETDAVQTELRATGGELQRYAEAIHRPNEHGLSAWSSRQRLLAAGPGPTATVDLTRLTPDPAVLHAVRACLERLPEASRVAGATAAHPWALASGTGDVTATVLTEALAELVRLHTALPLADPLLGPALRAAETAQDFRSLAVLLERPLPSAEVLDQVGSPAWQAVHGRVVADLSERRRTRPAVLDLYLPRAVELPLDEVLHAARQAADAGFLSRKGKLKQALALLAPACRAGVVPDPADVVGITLALLDVREQVLSARAAVAGVPGLTCGHDWNVFEDDALAVLEHCRASLVEAARLISPDTAFGRAVRPVVAARSTLDELGRVTLELLADAWSQVVVLLDASEASIERWRAGRPLHQAWTDCSTAWTTDAHEGFRLLHRWRCLQAELRPLVDAGLDAVVDELLTGVIDAADALPAFERGLAAAAFAERWEQAHLGSFDGESHDLRVARFARADQRLRSNQEREIPHAVVSARPFPAGQVTGQVGDLLREVSKTRGTSLRLLLERHHQMLSLLLPCFLMSPESVAQFLRPGLFDFDLVIFDEASQVRVAEAVGALGRARSAVIVGDSKQMPPTAFGAASGAGEVGDGFEVEDEVPVDQESILSECVEARVPRRWLTWHYRSQDESLIAFSNAKYYEGRLASFASPRSADPGTGLRFVPVAGQFLRSAKGDSLRTNPEEARAIVAEIRRRLADPREREASLGVITFNAQQQVLIDTLLLDCDDVNVLEALNREDDRRLFVKNLENVQGDERDVILFSVAFSKDERGVLPLRFGPLMNAGGERRLNVAVTRARRQVVVFCSFQPEDIDLSRTDSIGIRHLRSYLLLARDGVAAASDVIARRAAPLDRHRAEVAAALEAAGLRVAIDVGLSEFRIDLVVAPADAPDRPSLAVMLDGPAWGAGRRIQDRDVLPVEILTGLMGWPDVMRLWLPDWVRDPAGCTAAVAARAHAAWVELERERPPAPPPVPPLEEAAGTADELARTSSTPLVCDEPSVPAREELPRMAVEEAVEGAVEGAVARPPQDRTAEVERTLDPGPDPVRQDGEPADGGVFVPADETPVGSRDVLDLLPDPGAAAQVRREIRSVIEAEGPIEVTRLTRVVARRFGLSAVRSSRASAIAALIPAQQLRSSTLGDFAWPSGVDPDAWTAFRPAGPGRNRRLDEVAPEEIANVVLALLDDTEEMDLEAVVRATGEVFGVGRMGANVRARLEAVVGQLQDSGEIG